MFFTGVSQPGGNRSQPVGATGSASTGPAERRSEEGAGAAEPADAEARPEAEGEAAAGGADAEGGPAATVGAGGGASAGAEAPTARWIDLELVDPEGDPLPKAAFQVTDSTGKVVQGRTDEGGRARVEDMEPGECRFELIEGPDARPVDSGQAVSSGGGPGLSADDYGDATPPPAAADAAADKPAAAVVDWVELELRDAEGRPAAGAWVAVTDSAGKTVRARTDAAGLARAAGLAPGECSVKVDA